MDVNRSFQLEARSRTVVPRSLFLMSRVRAKTSCPAPLGWLRDHKQMFCLSSLAKRKYLDSRITGGRRTHLACARPIQFSISFYHWLRAALA
ncbi:hypothetical protein NDU88_003752 [Pleurodeles waltl]|uniref:Uncharacterized protein n=1 Tax=Pleurodeles waltl TaxID=8319 RepID=A0AAV7PE20_PLEWA|nr:hypothetical protein NDU88_003752 [Pleurodeles waltl]